jgi:hypothetical protein
MSVAVAGVAAGTTAWQPRLARLCSASDSLDTASPARARWLDGQHEVIGRAIALEQARGTNALPAAMGAPREDIAMLLDNVEATLALWQEEQALANASTCTVFNVRNFGARGDGIHNDGPAIREALKTAIRASRAEVLLPAGTYRIADLDPRGEHVLYPGLSHVTLAAPHEPDEVSMKRPGHLMIERAAHLLVRGEGPDKTMLVFAGPPLHDGLYLLQCRHTRLEGFSMDYDPLPYTQGTVTRALGPLHFEMDVDPGYAPPNADHILTKPRVTGAKFMMAHGDTFIDHPDTPGHFMIASAEPVKDRRYRIGLNPKDAEARGRDAFCLAGARAVIFGRNSTTPPLSVDSCANCRVHNVHMYASPAVAVRVIRNAFVEFSHCAIRPRSGTDRMAASNADGFFCQNNRIGPYLHHNRITQHGDDYFNLLSGMSIVHRLNGNRVVCRYGRSDNAAFRPGDRIYFLRGDSHAILSGNRVAAVSLERIDAALRLVLTLADVPGHAIRAADDPSGPPDWIFIRNAANIGAMIMDNDFRIGYRSRCIVRSAHTLVAENRIVNRNVTSRIHWGHGLIIGMHWHEGGPVRNVILRGNVIDGIDRMFKAPHIPSLDALVADVLIADNTIVNPVYKADEDLFDDADFRREALQNAVIEGNRFAPPPCRGGR